MPAQPPHLHSRLRALVAATLVLGVPATALAQAGKGKLLIVLYALPMLLPVLGTMAAMFALRISESRLVWRALCAVLGFNSAVLGALLAHVDAGMTGVILLLAQLFMAGTMLFTTTKAETQSTAARVFQRVRDVALCAVGPGLLVHAIARIGG